MSISRIKQDFPSMSIYNESGNLIQSFSDGKSALNNLETGKYFIKIIGKEESLMTYNLFFTTGLE